MRNLVFIVSIIALTASIVLFINFFGTSSIDVGEGVLKGTLTRAGSEHKDIVLIIAGSGPTDRNGNSILLEGRNDSLRQLSMELNKKGLDTFRYDKRTAGKSVKSFNSEPSFDSFLTDLISCVRWLKSKNYRNIYLAGHSQGSLLAILAARQEQVSGIISLAGAARRIDFVLEEQLKTTLEGQDNEEINYIFANLRNNIVVNNIPDKYNNLFAPVNQRFIINWMAYTPSIEVQKLSIPLLFINGDADSQVNESELEIFRETVPGAQFIVLKNTNHLFKMVGNDKENIESYSDPSYQLNRELTEAIVSFTDINR